MSTNQWQQVQGSSRNHRNRSSATNGTRGQATNSAAFAGGRGTWRPNAAGANISNNGQPLVGTPVAYHPRPLLAPFTDDMVIINPATQGSPPWDSRNRRIAPATRYVGRGTAQDPIVAWTCNFPYSYQGAEWELEDIENVARDEAMRLGFECIIIRQGPHNNMYERDHNNQETTVRTRSGTERTLVEADLHLTVYLGFDMRHCHIHGHIFLERKNPQDNTYPPTEVIIMQSPLSRYFLRPEDERVITEYWLLRGITAMNNTTGQYVTGI